MGWVPLPNVLLVKVAVVTPPVVLTATGLPVFVLSICHCTVPVGVPLPGAVTPMVAVKVTLCPDADGLAEELTVVVVLAGLTTCVSVPVLPAKLVSPE